MNSKYSNTLNLPHTSFSMKGNLLILEPNILKEWESQDIYNTIRLSRIGCKKFIIYDGPPYANGNLHCGHALNKILKDIIIKSKSLSGFDTPFIPGWDCHGLPIELNVEKNLLKSQTKDKIEKRIFRKHCRAYVNKQIHIQREEFKRLGVFGDWNNYYITMSHNYEANVIRALRDIINNGHLNYGLKPVHWCINCLSSLAEAEVEYEEIKSLSIDVAFYVEDFKTLLLNLFNIKLYKPIIVPIWTTTPWTIPMNEAVCINSKLQYSLIDMYINTYNVYCIVASKLVHITMNRYKIKKYKILCEIQGKKLEYIKLIHPLFKEKKVPVILGDHVNIYSGTGCVHTAPAHGLEDYYIGKIYNLPLNNKILDNGCYDYNIPVLQGKSIFNVNKIILDILAKNNTLLHSELTTHSYPHCWRHKTKLIFLSTAQWFISMEKNNLRKSILKTIENIHWIPNWGKKRFKELIKNRPDWCISRQRTWGIPIPIFIHKDQNNIHPNSIEFLDVISNFIENHGVDSYLDLDIFKYLNVDKQCYNIVDDILDVWFDSGVSHYIHRNNKSIDFPADIYLEGSDQYRGWFSSSLTTSVAIDKCSPYKSVLTHGHLVDNKGKKLSKSTGNYIKLNTLINKYGADILRLWVSSVDYRHEIRISDEIIQGNIDAYRRIRNTIRFLLSNLFDFSPENCVSSSQLVEIDKWIIKKCENIQKKIIELYEEYNFHTIYQIIHNFCSIDMGKFYLDIIKDRQYTTYKKSIARRSCQTAMFHIVNSITRWLAPILSFTAEEIWKNIPGNINNDSIFVQYWYNNFPNITDINMHDWENLKFVKNEVNRSLEINRNIGIIKSTLSAEIIIYANDKLFSILKKFGKELKFLFVTSKAIVLSKEQLHLKNNSMQEKDIIISVYASKYKKCIRCWHRAKEIGYIYKYPLLCLRCISNISEIEEIRKFF